MKKTRGQGQDLWEKFFAIYEMLRADHFSEADCVILEGLIKSWFENHFLKLHQAKDVTPYIHVWRHYALLLGVTSQCARSIWRKLAWMMLVHNKDKPKKLIVKTTKKM